MSTTTTIEPTRRDWMNVSADIHTEHREQIERVIAGLSWTSAKQAAMMPAIAINECIAQLRIPKVTAYATDGYLPLPDPPETAYYSIYGIEGNYKDARVRLYVLDRGSDLLPLCADVWQTELVPA